MSISDIRDAFNNSSLPTGLRCLSCTLVYCDNTGGSQGARDHQILAFEIVSSEGNTKKRLQTNPLPPGTDIVAAAIGVARDAMGLS